MNLSQIQKECQIVQKQKQSYYLGIDVGTSFIKVALVNNKGQLIELVKAPQTQMRVYSQKYLFCQQDPQQWWRYVCQATQVLKNKHPYIFNNKFIKSIGISYQMHGLVLVDQNHTVLRNAIIWSDGRTNQIGNQLKNLCIKHQLQQSLLNYPGNFTISKLKWIQQNQSQIYHKIYKILLPGDYIALRLTNQYKISQTGLSEAILWDFKRNELCQELLQLCKIQKQMIPQIVKSFSYQGKVTQKGSFQSGIPEGTIISYRSGDQPNNAYSLNVKQVGQIAASGGTSGTVLLVSQQTQSLQLSRINTFLHINHSIQKPRYAKLLCINSCGIIYSWLRKNFAEGKSYQQLDELGLSCQSQGLVVIPFGNGLERMLNHKNIKVSFKNIDLNRHSLKHIVRATLQSIAFSFVYGINILKHSQKPEAAVKKIKVSNDNIFNSKIVVQIIELVVGCRIEIVEGMTGAIGCAKAARQSWLNLLQNSQNVNQMNEIIKEKQQQLLKDKQQHHMSSENKKCRRKYLQLYKVWQTQLQKELTNCTIYK